jgi:hypothetical protein
MLTFTGLGASARGSPSQGAGQHRQGGFCCRLAVSHGAGSTQPGARRPAAAPRSASSVAAPRLTPDPDPTQRWLPHLAPSAPGLEWRCAVPSERELAGRRQAAGALVALLVAACSGHGGAHRPVQGGSCGTCARAAGLLPLTGAAVQRVYASVLHLRVASSNLQALPLTSDGRGHASERTLRTVYSTNGPLAPLQAVCGGAGGPTPPLEPRAREPPGGAAVC